MDYYTIALAFCQPPFPPSHGPSARRTRTVWSQDTLLQGRLFRFSKYFSSFLLGCLLLFPHFRLFYSFRRLRPFFLCAPVKNALSAPLRPIRASRRFQNFSLSKMPKNVEFFFCQWCSVSTLHEWKMLSFPWRIFSARGSVRQQPLAAAKGGMEAAPSVLSPCRHYYFKGGFLP